MRNITGLLIAAVGLAGCAPSEMSIFIGGAAFLNDVCEVEGEVNLAGGSLDILGDPTPRYIAHFSLVNDLQVIETQVGNDLLASGNRNDFVADTIITSYNISGGTAGPQNQRSSIYFIVPPGGGEGSSIQFNLISAAAAPAIAGMVAPGVGQELDLLVTFQFEGKLRSQPDSALTRFRTNQATFPIRVSNSGPPCILPEEPVVVGPCGNSQESFSLTCAIP